VSTDVRAEGEGYVAPGVAEFELPPFLGDTVLATKPVLLVAMSVLIIATFFIVAGRKRAMVPGRLQFAGEGVYDFVRNGIARDVIGHDFQKFVPYLTTLFCFILVNNIYGILPVAQFPTMSRIGFPIVLAVIAWLVYNYLGIKKKGFVGYFKTMMFPPGVPKPVYVLLAPLEFAQVILVRPLTLALRLFANMFAGHLLLLVFILGGDYMLNNESIVLNLLSPFAFGMGIVMTFFEALVQVLQAYIFTLLVSLYIAEALADEH
jgi:F-type H+-transporting ATPase subunit a